MDVKYLSSYNLIQKKDSNITLRAELLKPWVYPICEFFVKTKHLFTGQQVYGILNLYHMLRDKCLNDDDNPIYGRPWQNINVTDNYNALVNRKIKKNAESRLLSHEDINKPIDINLDDD